MGVTAPDLIVPPLTFPEREGELVREAYGAASCVLEYGTGGSTVLALDAGVDHLIAVESDKAWLDNLSRLVADRKPRTRVDLFHADIEPTKKWGSPKDHSQWPNYPSYPLAIWDQPFFEHPDLVLIDGRFRAACLLAVLTRATRPVTVLFDDYADRSPYHRVERFVTPSRLVGRIGVFELEPWTFDPALLTPFVETFFKVR